MHQCPDPVYEDVLKFGTVAGSNFNSFLHNAYSTIAYAFRLTQATDPAKGLERVRLPHSGNGDRGMAQFCILTDPGNGSRVHIFQNCSLLRSTHVCVAAVNALRSRASPVSLRKATALIHLLNFIRP